MKKLFLLSLLAIQPVLSLCQNDSESNLTEKDITKLESDMQEAENTAELKLAKYFLLPSLILGTGFIGIIATQGFNNPTESIWNNLEFKAKCASLICLSAASITMALYHQGKQQARLMFSELYKRCFFKALRAIKDNKNNHLTTLKLIENGLKPMDIKVQYV